jgi:1,4-dihydroxy-2-naphthoate octaprenyltransferase
MEKFKKYIPQLFYLAAILNFIASTIAAIFGKASGTSLGIGSLCLCLGLFYSEKAKKNKE